MLPPPGTLNRVVQGSAVGSAEHTRAQAGMVGVEILCGTGGGRLPAVATQQRSQGLQPLGRGGCKAVLSPALHAALV